ncbi:MAG: exopolysaccharide Pel transporter PelG [Lachnospiraceae bacterium]|nr:exopolysaccharide Pel transporter PelG [Lachnospiraceae bacterium]
MAGIGFSLKRLFHKKGIINLCKAYGYSGIVTIGPMILGVLLLLGVSLVARLGGMPDHDRELLNCMLTYSLLVALLVTSWFNMVVTRYVSDMLYMGKEERVMPSFFGSVAIELVICFVSYGLFLIISGNDPLQCILCLWLSMVLVVVWTQIIYLTALKDFQSIVLTFTISLMIGYLAALILVLLGWVCIETLLLCVILAYGILAVRQLQLMLNYFPKSEGSHFLFLRWFNRYPTLALSGGMVKLGLFTHIVIMYFGPLAVQVEGLFYGAPEYDVPALLAFFSLLITTVSFVVSVEVNFYPHYSNYYGLFSDKGAIKDIKLAEKEMIDVLQRELIYLGCKQVFTTFLFVVVGPVIIEAIDPGISMLSLMVFKFLCAGYGTYAIANSVMLMELYFEDYKGAFIGTTLFAVVSTAATVFQICFGDPNFFGVGFCIGCLVFYFYALTRLDNYIRKLPYYLLSRQNLLPEEETGFFVSLSEILERRYERFLQREGRLAAKEEKESA